MSKKYNILVPDDLHLNQRNFPSFHKFIAKTGSSIKFIKERKDWIALYGDYESKASVLNEKARVLSCLPADILFNYSVKGVNLFKISRAEALSKVAVEPEWYETAYPSSVKEIFNKLLTNNKRVLMLCLAAAWDWIDFWSGVLYDEKTFTHCCVFSGSLIYQRSLIELLRYTPTKVMVMESLFTGNDYYCEEKYGPISNNCEIRHKAVYDSLAFDVSANELDRERIKAINKIILAKNKNVTQPEFGEEISFPNSGKIVTILGQVINDFSLLEYQNKGVSSIAFYKEFITELIQRDFNVVFKAHPWEEEKTHVKSSLTRDILLKFIDELPDAQKYRIKIVDHYPIDKLFLKSDFIAGLNSQSLIEAAFNGLKPIQFGNAFFGGKGFTFDYSIKECRRCVEDLISGNLSGTLSIKEYRMFEEFSLRLLQKQLVSVHDSGITKLNSLFEGVNVISLARSLKSQANVSTTSSENRIESSISKGKEISNTVNSSSKIENLVLESNHEEFKNNKVKKKFRKFLTNPRKFFADSDNYIIRTMRHLFSRKS